MCFYSCVSELWAHDEDRKSAQDSWSRTIHVLLPASASVALFSPFYSSWLPSFSSFPFVAAQPSTSCHLLWSKSCLGSALSILGRYQKVEGEGLLTFGGADTAEVIDQRRDRTAKLLVYA